MYGESWTSCDAITVVMTPTHKTHLCRTVWSQRVPHTHCAWLGSRRSSSSRPSVICKHLCAPKLVLSLLLCQMSHPWLSSHAPSSISTSSTSPTTQRAHSVHPALQAPSIDKLRHQESLRRENLQSGGNTRKTTPTGFEPKELATVSRIEAYSADPNQLHDVQENFGEEDHRAPITEEVKELAEFRTAGLPGSHLSETSYFQLHIHFDDSAENIADSDLEDGELQKMLTSPMYAQKASGKPDAVVVQEREVSEQFTQADRKESLTSHSRDGQKALVKPNALFSSEHGNLIRSSVFRNANPLNLRETRITCSVKQDQTWRSKNFMSNLSMSASVNYNYERKRKDWHYKTHNTDLLNLDENKFDYKQNYLWKKVLRHTQIRNMYEMEEIKRAHELRVDSLCAKT